MLLGAVSISNRYASMSKQLLMSFLRINRYLPSLGKLIAPRRPPALSPPAGLDAQTLGTVVRDIDDVDQLLREIEADRLSIPVLVRQYLKLNARLLGFNVDPDFGDVLDALMLVDLTQVPRPILARYMGPSESAGYLAYHAGQSLLKSSDRPA
jgi:hypothetical protein